jgi:hypothetical protein
MPFASLAQLSRGPRPFGVTPRTRWRALLFLGAGLAALPLLGCQSDEITKYRVERVEKPQQRFLGAIIPHQDKVWFVKVKGPESAVKEEAPAFEQFVASIQFPDKKGEAPIIWKTPEKWQRAEGKAGRFATFALGPKDQPLELTVTPLERKGKAASVLDNVNRWRGQVGLMQVGKAELGQMTRQLKLAGGDEATLVDLTGPGAGKMAQRQRPVEERPGPRAAALGRPKLKYEMPPGWKELPGDDLRVAAFKVADGEQAATVTVIPLPGGDLLANVNRWRNQLGLPPIEADQVKRDVKSIKVAGTDAPYVDLTGPEKAGGRQRILAVMLAREGRTWFFKMTGPDELLGRQKQAFERFVASVRFAGGGENDR